MINEQRIREFAVSMAHGAIEEQEYLNFVEINDEEGWGLSKDEVREAARISRTCFAQLPDKGAD